MPKGGIQQGSMISPFFKGRIFKVDFNKGTWLIVSELGTVTLLLRLRDSGIIL